MSNLPTVILKDVNLINPDWNGTDLKDYMKPQTREWEVLTVYFEEETMRARTLWQGVKVVQDFPATEFFKKYVIADKTILEKIFG